jgi:peptidoglycan glycosyltransferase
MFSHLVGYDGHGRAGLELSANFYLLRSHVNIFERVYNELAENKNRGDTVVTTVSYKLQSAAYEALGNCNGAVVAIEPSTGRILAMVSKPDYDANDLESLWDYLQTDEGSSSTVLLNRATQGLYAPGSTFKIVSLLEYMRENPTTYGDYTYTCQGSDIFSSVTIHCYNSTAHGQETLADSLAYSCNSSFANIGTTLDSGSYRRTADELLFNSELPYDGEYNESSFVISADSDDSEIPQTVIGQGDTRITPLHNCMIVAAIANGGVLMKPYLIDRIENDDGAKIKSFGAKTYGSLMTSEEAQNLTEYMKTVCDYGTAANIMGGASYDVAGKTGTAEYDNEGNSNSWFVGFTNPDSPDIAISVVVEDYNTNGVSATTVAKKVFDAYYNN